MPPQIADLIREGRLRKGMNQDDLARRAGVSRTTLHHLERGAVQKPRASTLARIAATLEIPFEEFARLWESGTTSPAAPGVSTANADSDGRPPASGFNPAAAFDFQTNPQLSAYRDQHRDQCADLSMSDWQQLSSQFGVGGGLTEAGAELAIDRLRADRATVSRLQLVLQTHLRDIAEKLVTALYESVAISEQT